MPLGFRSRGKQVTVADMVHRGVIALLAVFALGGSATVFAAPESGSRPNVLFLIADDLSYEAVRALSDLDIDTPNLDRLVHDGTTFTHTYNMGAWSGAICVASRTMLMTGRSLYDAGKVNDHLVAEIDEQQFWPQLMKSAGYRTLMTGKWHVKAPIERAFDEVRNPRGGMPRSIGGYDRPYEHGYDWWDPADPKLHGFWRGGKHWSEVTADDAVDYLGEVADEEDPFFMYVSFSAPHDPRQAPQEYLDRYPLERIALPENYQPEYPHRLEIGLFKGQRDESLAPFPRTEFAVKTHRKEYFAIITHMDDQIGRILDALEASGRSGETLIFFTADHGLAVGRHGLLGKQNMYDHSLRVPFMMVGPGITAGRKIETPIYLQDAMPTTLDLAGVEIPDQVYYQSLLPLLHGGDGAEMRDAMVGSYLGKQRAFIRDGWKLIAYPDVPLLRLYHLDEDPLELHDLANDAAQQSRLRGMMQGMQDELAALGDYLDLTPTFAEFL